MAAITQAQPQPHSRPQQQQHHPHNAQYPLNSTLPMLHTHSIQSMPHGLGLLTTVASLPPKYRSRYLKIQTKCEIPLDLSVKPMSPQEHGDQDVPMAVNFTEVYTEPCSDTQSSQASEDIVEEICSSLAVNNDNKLGETTTTNNNTNILYAQSQDHNKPITPPLTPTTKRKFSETDMETDTEFKENHNKIAKIDENSHKQPLMENTPSKQPIKTSDTAPKTGKNASSNGSTKSNRSNKATRKLKFDEETSSPVSGTIIRPLEDITDGSMQYSNGDIDPKYNIVEITEETKAELAAIKNVIGDYICKLCRIKFDDAFGLAQHRCACIVLLEYRCPECGKQFNCPANLASHRRWHKPRKNNPPSANNTSSNATVVISQIKKENREVKMSKSGQNEADSMAYACQQCGKKFKRQAYLKKHELTHQKAGGQQSAVATSVITHEISPNSSRSNNSSPIGGTTSPQTQMQPQTQATPSPPPPSTPITPLPLYEEVVITQTQLEHHQQRTQPPSYQQHHHTYVDDDQEDDTMSDYSSSATSSHNYGRLQIVETGLTEEENIAAAALTNLRNCASVIQHTTLAH